ncbi:hypothetical protein B0H14DRAFT_3156457, partial [Mycena olivaceomarginata]
MSGMIGKNEGGAKKKEREMNIHLNAPAAKPHPHVLPAVLSASAMRCAPNGAGAPINQDTCAGRGVRGAGWEGSKAGMKGGSGGGKVSPSQHGNNEDGSKEKYGSGDGDSTGEDAQSPNGIPPERVKPFLVNENIGVRRRPTPPQATVREEEKWEIGMKGVRGSRGGDEAAPGWRARGHAAAATWRRDGTGGETAVEVKRDGQGGTRSGTSVPRLTRGRSGEAGRNGHGDADAQGRGAGAADEGEGVGEEGT